MASYLPSQTSEPTEIAGGGLSRPYGQLGPDRVSGQMFLYPEETSGSLLGLAGI